MLNLDAAEQKEQQGFIGKSYHDRHGRKIVIAGIAPPWPHDTEPRFFVYLENGHYWACRASLLVDALARERAHLERAD